MQSFISTNNFIKQDRADKLEDQLSTIGGTMGLLTGFSIISAVELLYFIIKIGGDLLNNIKQKYSTYLEQVDRWHHE